MSQSEVLSQTPREKAQHVSSESQNVSVGARRSALELVRFSMLSRGGVKLRSRASELACTGVKRVECVRLRLELARFDFLDATHAACFVVRAAVPLVQELYRRSSQHFNRP